MRFTPAGGGHRSVRFEPEHAADLFTYLGAHHFTGFPLGPFLSCAHVIGCVADHDGRGFLTVTQLVTAVMEAKEEPKQALKKVVCAQHYPKHYGFCLTIVPRPDRSYLSPQCGAKAATRAQGNAIVAAGRLKKGATAASTTQAPQQASAGDGGRESTVGSPWPARTPPPTGRGVHKGPTWSNGRVAPAAPTAAPLDAVGPTPAEPHIPALMRLPPAPTTHLVD